jgi:A/G-specific adenine glycosylase
MPNDFSAKLMTWYDRTAAQLPWRTDDPNPYHVWLSEVMLQQTQVNTVRDYYIRFLASYPSIHDLAAVPLDNVLKLWEGLGYYSRARNLHKTAQIVAREMNGKFPETVEGLMALPGIGRYTAGAIASIAFGATAPILDGNVIRVYARLTDLTDDVTKPGTQNDLWTLAEAWLPDERPGDYNQAVMDLGRMICKPRKPLCDECPIRAYCAAYANGTQHDRPVKTKKKPVPHYDVAAGIIRDEAGRILIAQRPLESLLGGLWEFPGGKQEADEDLPQTLQRELREELGIEVEVGRLFVAVKHGFTHFKITLHAYECRHTGGEPQALQVRDFVWITEDRFDDYSFGKADRMVIEALEKRRGMLF